MSTKSTMTIEKLWALIRETENDYRMIGDILLGYYRLKQARAKAGGGVAARPGSLGQQESPGDRPLGSCEPESGSLGRQESLRDQPLGRGVPEPGALGQQHTAITCDNPPWCEIAVETARKLLTDASKNASRIAVEFTELLADERDDIKIRINRTTLLGINWLDKGKAGGPGSQG
jgi:hypothetical protein